MNTKITLAIATILALSGCVVKNPAADTLTIKVVPPANYNASEPIHVVGSFNAWALDGEKAYEKKTKNS